MSHLEQCSSASAGPTRPGTAGQEMLPRLGLDDVVLVVVSSALVCCTCFVAPALLLLMTATATTLPEPTLTDAAPPPRPRSLPVPVLPTSLSCAIAAALWQSFAQNSPAVLSCLTGRCASGHDEDDSLGKFSPQTERRRVGVLFPIPNARCADQNYLRQAIFVIKRTKPSILPRPAPPP